MEEILPPLSSQIPSETEVDTEAWQYWRFTVEVLRSGKWNCSIPDDKDTCPGRPPVYVFPQKLTTPQVLEGEAIVTELFLLLPLTGDCGPGQLHSVIFKSMK